VAPAANSPTSQFSKGSPWAGSGLLVAGFIRIVISNLVNLFFFLAARGETFKLAHLFLRAWRVGLSTVVEP